MRRPTSEEIVNDGLETMISTIAGFTLGLGIVGGVYTGNQELAPLVRDSVFIASTGAYVGLMLREGLLPHLRRPARGLLYTAGYAGLLAGSSFPLM